MDRYEVELLEKAYRDLDDIYTYIASEFLAPETARKQLNRLKEAILGLVAFPNSHPAHAENLLRLFGCGKQSITQTWFSVFNFLLCVTHVL